MVHRLLQKVLTYGVQAKDHVEVERELDIMNKCNNAKLNSRRVSDDCDKLFMCLYLKNAPIKTKAVVMSFSVISITLMVPSLNFEKRFNFKDYKSVIRTEYDNEE